MKVIQSMHRTTIHVVYQIKGSTCDNFNQSVMYVFDIHANKLEVIVDLQIWMATQKCHKSAFQPTGGLSELYDNMIF